LLCTCEIEVLLLIFSVNGRNMTMVQGKFKRTKRDHASEEWKSHGWWIDGERGPSALPKQCAQLYIDKEPIKTHMSTSYEFNAGTVLSISIRNSGQDHFFITTRSHDDGVTKKNFTLLSLNMLRPLSRKSKAKDILENLEFHHMSSASEKSCPREGNRLRRRIMGPWRAFMQSGESLLTTLAHYQCKLLAIFFIVPIKAFVHVYNYIVLATLGMWEYLL
jgi:hypothetical protein